MAAATALHPEPPRAGEEPDGVDRLPHALRAITDACVAVDSRYANHLCDEQISRAFLGRAGQVAAQH